MKAPPLVYNLWSWYSIICRSKPALFRDLQCGLYLGEFVVFLYRQWTSVRKVECRRMETCCDPLQSVANNTSNNDIKNTYREECLNYLYSSHALGAHVPRFSRAKLHLMPQVNNLAILPKQYFKELTQVLWSYSAQQDMVYLSNNLARFEGPPPPDWKNFILGAPSPRNNVNSACYYSCSLPYL